MNQVVKSLCERAWLVRELKEGKLEEGRTRDQLLLQCRQLMTSRWRGSRWF